MTLLFILLLVGTAYVVVRAVWPRVFMFESIESDGRRWLSPVGYMKTDGSLYDPSRRRGERRIGQVFLDGERAVVRVYRFGDRAEAESDDIGTVDVEGRVYESGRDTPFATVASHGTRRWYELWLRCHADVPADSTPRVGVVIEALCLGARQPAGPTRLARAGAALLLLERLRALRREAPRAAPRSRNDLALIATLIYWVLFQFTPVTLLFADEYMLFPALGPEWSYVVSMLLLYGVIWGVLAILRRTIQNESELADEWLHLLNRQTGLRVWSALGCALAIAGVIWTLQVDAYLYFPLFLVLFFTFASLALFAPAWAWQVEPRSRRPRVRRELPPVPTTDVTVRSYSWDLDSPLRRLHFATVAVFRPAEIEEARSANPFGVGLAEAHSNLERTCADLVRSGERAPQVRWLAQYIEERSATERLTQLEEIQAALDFVQTPNIKYALDEDCAEIGNPVDYFRFPVETMYDKCGDCDCKSVLAAALMRTLGYPVLLLVSGEAEHAAIAVGGIPDLGAAGEALTVEVEGRRYYFCETTGDGWRVGQETNRAGIMLADRRGFVDLTRDLPEDQP